MKILKILGLCVGAIVALIIVALVILGNMLPETSIYHGSQVPKRYMKEVRSLGLLDKGEEIKYFYTDAMFDIKDGFYFVSDKNLTIYCQEWEEPETIIPFDQITYMEEEFNGSFFEDSFVNIETIDGYELSFPLSSEKGRDKKFVAHIRSKMVVQSDELVDIDNSDLEPEATPTQADQE